METLIHHLEISVESARADVRLNGLPLPGIAARDENGASYAPPVNPYLCGARNVVEVTLDVSTGFDGQPLPFTRARFELLLRTFEKGGVVEPGGGTVVTRFVPTPELLAEIADERRTAPITVTHRFATEGASFAAELLDAEPWEEDAALRDYAMKLRTLAVRRDVAGLLAEYEPKIHVWSRAYAEPAPLFTDSLREELTQFFIPGADVAFTRDDVELRPWCGGRIWELRRAGRLPLLRTLPGAEGERTELSAFVAPRGGQLRLVR